MDIQFPPFLQKGDKVVIVSPSSKIDQQFLKGAKKRMESWGLKVAIGKHAGSSSGRYAGTIKQRLKDLQDAMDDPKVKLSNSTFTVLNDNFKILDCPVDLVGWDIADKFSFLNCVVANSQRLYPYETTLMQKLRGVSSDGIIWTTLANYDMNWNVLGAVISSPMRNTLEIDLADNLTVKLNFMFKGVEPLLQGYEVLGEGVEDIEFGYAVSGQFCVLLFRAKRNASFNPIIYDTLGSGRFMPTPYKGKKYTLVDYGLSDSDIKILSH